MHYSHNDWLAFVLLVSFAGCSALLQAQEFQVGTTPAPQEIKAWDISIGIDGKELPPGKGTAKEGEEIYKKKCMACHGPDLMGSVIAPRLVGGRGTLKDHNPVRTIGSYYPYATTVWDYIHRAMPRWNERTLTPDEVYATTAYIFYKNDIIKENDVLDQNTLPKVQMPNRDGFIPKRFEDLADYEKRGCRVGHCP